MVVQFAGYRRYPNVGWIPEITWETYVSEMSWEYYDHDMDDCVIIAYNHELDTFAWVKDGDYDA